MLFGLLLVIVGLVASVVFDPTFPLIPIISILLIPSSPLELR